MNDAADKAEIEEEEGGETHKEEKEGGEKNHNDGLEEERKKLWVWFRRRGMLVVIKGWRRH